ncbi:MAG: 30S ribosomal protein S15 [Candidatus Caenarcaniphilales bacterium]|nr:30S ribosomal protein S15 [Candidatus Caenarcaniphilales bacterium]
MLTKEKKREIVSKYQKHTFDTGSPEVQVAICTNQILEIMDHLKTNKKDYSSLRGLQKLVSRRKRLLAYLQKISPSRYVHLIKDLGIRG